MKIMICNYENRKNNINVNICIVNFLYAEFMFNIYIY